MVVQNYRFGSSLIALTFSGLMFATLGFWLESASLSRQKRQRTSKVAAAEMQTFRAVSAPGCSSAVSSSLEVGSTSKTEIDLIEKDATNASATGCDLELQNLCKLFNGVPAVKNLNLTMRSGEIFCLLGHNGAGKTTTLAMITGELQPDAGEVRFADRPMHSQKNFAAQVGFCPQEDVLFELLTVHDHFELFARLKNSSLEHNKLQHALEEVGLLPYANVLAKHLSGGNRRKL